MANKKSASQTPSVQLTLLVAHQVIWQSPCGSAVFLYFLVRRVHILNAAGVDDEIDPDIVRGAALADADTV